MTRKTFPARTFLSLSALALLITGGLLYAGPLNPPGGPVTGTYKTLTEVEPRTAVNAANTPGDADSLFKITAPGSYYLTGNITGVVGKHGVEIVASGVTLDLNGFDLSGVPGSLDGVAATALNIRGVSVVNGTVRNWGDDGIDLASFSTFNVRVERVAVIGNADLGVWVNLNSIVSNCSASFNGSYGIYANDGATVSNCTVSHNTGFGIYAALACTVTNCTSQFNSGGGIRAVTGCTISDCVTRGNSTNGITAQNGSVIRGNLCTSNGNSGDGAGILAESFDNRIEDNHCTGADRGIHAAVAGNVIVRNTCSGNTTDWVIAANNIFGPIIDRRAPASAAVSGFSAASSLGSTDANANFSY